MLIEAGCPAQRVQRRGSELDGVGDQFGIAVGAGHLDALDHVAGPQMGVVKQIRGRIQRTARHLATQQPRHLVLGPRSSPSGNRGIDHGLVGHPRLEGGGARILKEIVAFHGSAQSLPMLRPRRGDGHATVVSRIDAERRQVRMARPSGTERPAPHAVVHEQRLAEKRHGVIHAHIDKLPYASAPRLMHGSDHAEGHQGAGIQVADAGAGRIATGLARGRRRTVDVGEATHALGNDVEGRPIRIGALASAPVAEATHCAIDDGRIAGANGLVAAAEPVHDAVARVLDHGIDPLRELEKEFPVVRILQVERDASLVAVDAGEVAAIVAARPRFRRRGGEVLRVRRQAAAQIPGRRLHLDDVGAQVSQHRRAEGAGQGHGAI